MDKINGIILDGNLHLLEQCFDDCVCNTCSLQRECEINAPNLCEIIFENLGGDEHFVNKGPLYNEVIIKP